MHYWPPPLLSYESWPMPNIVELAYLPVRNAEQQADESGVCSAAGIPGYTEDQWTQSPMMAYLRWHAKEYLPVIFSNTNDAVYFLTGLNALSLPHKDVPGEIIRFRNNPSFYLVWFFFGENPDLIDREFIQQHFTLKASWQFEDGIIYRY